MIPTRPLLLSQLTPELLRQHCQITDPRLEVELIQAEDDLTCYKYLQAPSPEACSQAAALGMPLFPIQTLMTLTRLRGRDNRFLEIEGCGGVRAGAYFKRNKGGGITGAVVVYSLISPRREDEEDQGARFGDMDERQEEPTPLCEACQQPTTWDSGDPDVGWPGKFLCTNETCALYEEV